MSARRIVIAALLPFALISYACSSGGEGAPPEFSLGFGEEKTAGGNVTTPAPAFGPTPGKGSAGDAGQTEEGGTADSARPDTRPAFDAAGFDTAGFDTEGLDLGI